MYTGFEYCGEVDVSRLIGEDIVLPALEMVKEAVKGGSQVR